MKNKKIPFKQRMFNKFLEKPITDVLIVSYDLYKLSCSVYLDADKIPNFEEYCQLIKENLNHLYNGDDAFC